MVKDAILRYFLFCSKVWTYHLRCQILGLLFESLMPVLVLVLNGSKKIHFTLLTHFWYRNSFTVTFHIYFPSKYSVIQISACVVSWSNHFVNDISNFGIFNLLVWSIKRSHFTYIKYFFLICQAQNRLNVPYNAANLLHINGNTYTYNLVFIKTQIYHDRYRLYNSNILMK